MQKKLIIIVLIIIMVVILITGLLSKIKVKMYLLSYDIVVGSQNESMMFGGDKFLIGYKNGETYDLGHKFTEDKSNFNRVIAVNDKITYFDQKTCNEFFKEIGSTPVLGYRVGTMHEEIFMKYYNNYKYNEKDKEVFDKIVELLEPENKDPEKMVPFYYFFITKNNYYIAKDQSIYQYEEKNNTLNILFSFSGELKLFKAK